MLSRQQIKFIKSLHLKKIRKELQLFVAEGSKLVEELISGRLETHSVLAVDVWLQKNRSVIANKNIKAFVVTETELEQISTQKSANQAIGIFRIPVFQFNPEILNEEIVLMLDDINDPGNLGTILRTADWFGIQHVICSKNTVELYNLKTVQATMGSIARISTYYLDFQDILSNTKAPVYGALLNGKPLTEINPSKNGVIIIGNEAHGISTTLHQFITQPLFIPSFIAEGAGLHRPESLNAAMAAAILCWEFRKNG